MKTFNFSQLITPSGIGRECTESQSRYYRGNPRLYTYLNRTLVVLFAFLTLGVGQMWGAWTGNAGICVNGDWYKASDHIDGGNWLNSKSTFNSTDLGAITSLELGGQYDNYDNGQDDACNWNSNNGIWITITTNSGTQIDNFKLSCYRDGKSGSNNVWKTTGTIGTCGDGSSWAAYSVDISGYAAGVYKLKVHWFSASGVALPSSGDDVATFRIDPTITFDKQSGSGGTSSITAPYGSAMPAITLPTRDGYSFEGYYTEKNGGGTRYYYHNGSSAHECDFASKTPKLYANWVAKSTVTFYYAAPADIIACNTVKCYYDCGYDQTSDADMIKTDYTYDGKLIYSLEVTANYGNFNGIYFKPKGWSGAGSEEQTGCSTWTSANTYEDQMFVHGSGWQAYSKDASYTVYFVNNSNWTTPKAYAFNSACDYNVAYSTSEALTNTGKTYGGKAIYSITFAKRYAKIVFNNNGTETKTGDLTLGTTNAGKMFTFASSITDWVTLAWDVALDRQGGTTGSISITATQGAAMPAITTPGGKTGYTFGGYFTGEGGSGTKYYAANGSSAASWSEADATTLYAKWTQSITLDREGATSGSTSLAATYNATLDLTSYTAPTRTGYNFAGYWTGDNGTGSMVISSTGVVQTVASWTDSDKKWIHAGASTLYAKWTEKTHTVTLANDGHGVVKIGGSTVTEVTVGEVTASSAITAVANTGYHFDNWTIPSGVTIASGSITSATITINATADSKTVTANFAANDYTITLDANGGEGGTASVTATYDATPPTGDGKGNYYFNIINPHNIGYKFLGWYTDEDGGSKVIDSLGYFCAPVEGYTSNDPGNIWIRPYNTTLYAHWAEDSNTFNNAKGDGNWNDPDNWTGGVVPTNDYSSVTINAEVELSSYVHIGQLTIGGSGKLTIQPTGTLEVAGSVTNTEADKLVINTDPDNQGALIYDITQTAPNATVYMTTYNASSGFQYIASPVGGASVSGTFAGKGVYTYAWVEGKGWDRRGYYDDFSGNEVILLTGQTRCVFSGLLSPTTGGSLSYTTSGENFNEDAQGVNMIPNTLTAPIKIAAMSFSGSYDNGVHVWENGSWHDYASAAAAEAVIPALQGYAVLASSSGSVSFDYDEAVRGAATHNDALRAPKRTTSDVPEYMTISVTTNERKIDLQLSEHEQFSDAIDKGWETIYMEGDGRFGQLYAHGEKEMSILATNNLEGTVLGFVPGETNSYIISFEGDGEGYYLNDVVMDQSTLIAEGNTYEFTPIEGTNATRFVVSRTPIYKVPTDVTAAGMQSDNSGARKQMIDGTLYIIHNGRIFSTTGAVVK